MLWDTHMHTEFSTDSNAKPEAMADAAIAAGLDGICITDHLDYDYPKAPVAAEVENILDNASDQTSGEPEFMLNLPEYAHAIHQLQEEYSGRLPILYGIEIGLQPQVAADNRRVTEQYPFDFVIGSSHVVHGQDPYYPAFYEGKTQEEAYREYFDSILENLDADADFDVYGHLDYVVRYGPNKNHNYSWRQYADVIDEILRRLIGAGKGIELNTAGFKYGLGHPNPKEDILRRYRELGGEILTIGADAHRPEHVAYAFDKAVGIAREAGFSYYTVFHQRKPEFVAFRNL